jgi:hypothetical protein
MKNLFSVLLITLLMLLAGQAGASFWFQVREITPIEMMPNSEANFTVSVKGMGSERAYVELVFKNKTDGFDFSCQKIIKNVFPAGVTQYNCSVKAADVPPGNYSFVVDVAATGSPSGKKTGFINVLAKDAGRTIDPMANEGAAEGPLAGTQTQTQTQNQNQKTPAFGAITAIFAMLLVMRRMTG